MDLRLPYVQFLVLAVSEPPLPQLKPPKPHVMNTPQQDYIQHWLFWTGEWLFAVSLENGSHTLLLFVESVGTIILTMTLEIYWCRYLRTIFSHHVPNKCCLRLNGSHCKLPDDQAECMRGQLQMHIRLISDSWHFRGASRRIVVTSDQIFAWIRTTVGFSDPTVGANARHAISKVKIGPSETLD